MFVKDRYLLNRKYGPTTRNNNLEANHGLIMGFKWLEAHANELMNQ